MTKEFNNEQLLKQVREAIKHKVEMLETFSHSKAVASARDFESLARTTQFRIDEYKTDLLALCFMEKMLGEPSDDLIEAMECGYNYDMIYSIDEDCNCMEACYKSMVQQALKEIKELEE